MANRKPSKNDLIKAMEEVHHYSSRKGVLPKKLQELIDKEEKAAKLVDKSYKSSKAYTKVERARIALNKAADELEAFLRTDAKHKELQREKERLCRERSSLQEKLRGEWLDKMHRIKQQLLIEGVTDEIIAEVKKLINECNE